MKLQLRGRPFEINEKDNGITCIYKALATLPPGESVSGNELYAALKAGHYSEASLRQTMAHDRTYFIKERRTNANNRRYCEYSIDPHPSQPFVPGTTDKLTKKQKSEHWEAMHPGRRMLKYG